MQNGLKFDHTESDMTKLLKRITCFCFFACTTLTTSCYAQSVSRDASDPDQDAASPLVANATTTTPYPANPAFANNALGTITPYRGNYREKAVVYPAILGRIFVAVKPIVALQVDIGLSGNAFVTVSSTRALGGTDWDVIQGIYQPADEVTRWNTGVIGTLNGLIYPSANGLCLKCAINDAGASATAMAVTLTWTNSREVTMTVGTQTWHFVAPNRDTGSDGDYFVGRWAIHVLQTYNQGAPSAYLHDGLGVIDIAPTPGNLVLSGDVAPGSTTYAPGDQLYTWTCEETVSIVYPNPNPLCDESFAPLTLGNPGSALTFWYDKSANKLAADLAFNGVIHAANVHVDFYVDGPDLIIGRGIVEGTAKVGVDGAPYGVARDGALNLQIILQRLPDDAFGGDVPKQ
jgi:hypothetical protein